MRASPLHIVDGATKGPDGRPLHPFARLVETVKAPMAFTEEQAPHIEYARREGHEGGDGI